MEAETRVVQLRDAGAEKDSEMSGQLEDALSVMKHCEMMVDVASDELQKSVVRSFMSHSSCTSHITTLQYHSITE